MFQRFKNNKNLYIYANSALCAIIVHFSSFAQNPLCYNDVVNSINKTTSEAELVERIEKNKVTFYLNSIDSAALIRLGASERVLRAIAMNKKIVKVPIPFTGWRPFGEIAIAPCNNNMNVLCKGRSARYTGLTTSRTFHIGDNRILVVRIEDVQASTFTDHNAMLRVFASESNETVPCIADSLLAPGNREFVIQRDGEFRYRIPESMIRRGLFTKLGLQFGPGEYKTFKISAWFE